MEVVVRIQYVQVLYDFLVGDVSLREARRLVEDGKGVAHTAVGLLGDDVQCLLLVLYVLLFGNAFQMADDVRHGHALEVVDLAAGQDGREDLVLLGRREDEDDVCRRLFQSLQESIESRRGKHVHLVDDEDLVPPYLRRDARLVHQRLDVFH